MTRVKVCGLTRREDVETALELGVDALGFILVESPRKVTLEQVAGLTAGIVPFVSTVAVVKDPSEEELKDIVGSGLFSHVQFHGHEDPALMKGLGVRTIKAFGISGPEDLKGIAAYGESDFFLFDARVGAASGGTGRTFDWSLLEGVGIEKPFILAGGLGPENVAEAIRGCRPAAVDLNSRLETAPGVKDPERMGRAVRKIRAAG
jgi:phosphoribosylanthranilate isomerase